MPRRAKFLVKLALSGAMLLIILRVVNLAQLKHLILSIPLTTAILVVLGYFLGQLISSVKWWLLARAGGVEVPYVSALKAYFIGMFVNCFGLGVVGGDVVRGLLLAEGRPIKTAALATVIADRVSGLAILAGIGAVSVLLFPVPEHVATVDQWLVVIGFALLAGWFAGPWFLLKIVPRSNRFRPKAEQIAHAFPKTGGTLLIITALSVLFHLTQIGLHIVMAQGVGATLTWPQVLVSVPFINILSTLPISWNGLGVRENSYSFFLVPALLSSEQAVAFGAMWLLAITISSAIGGVVALLTPDWKASIKSNRQMTPVQNQVQTSA